MTGFSVEIAADLLAKMADAAARVAESKGTMPELGYVVLAASVTPEGGQLRCEAYDLELSVSTSFPCSITTPGRVAVSGKLLANITKALSDIVTLEIKKDRLVVRDGRGSYTLPTLPSLNMPAMPDATKLTWRQTQALTLSEAIEATRRCVSDDESRYNLNGIHFRVPKDGLQVVEATDGHTASMIITHETIPLERSIIIPTKATIAIKRLCDAASDGAIEVASDGVSVGCRNGSTTLVCRLVDGVYPAVDMAIPADHGAYIELSRAELMSAVRRFDPMRDSTIKMTVAGPELRLETNSPDAGSADAVMRVKGETEGKRIGVSHRLLLAGLESFTAADIRIQIADELSAIVIRPLEGKSQVVVVMPIRLD